MKTAIGHNMDGAWVWTDEVEVGVVLDVPFTLSDLEISHIEMRYSRQPLVTWQAIGDALWPQYAPSYRVIKARQCFARAQRKLWQAYGHHFRSLHLDDRWKPIINMVGPALFRAGWKGPVA